MVIKTSSAKLRRRHTQSAIVSELSVAIVLAMQRAYRAKNIGTLVEHYMVAMAIRLNDEAGSAPHTVSSLAAFLKMPRTSVGRHVDDLVGEGMIRRDGHALVGDLGYLEKRISADYFSIVCKAILKAADALRKTGVTGLVALGWWAATKTAA